MSEENKAPHAYEGLDRAIHERARLAVLTALVRTHKPISFSELLKLCDMTNGNLSRHLQSLEKEEMIVIDKGYDGKKPQTNVSLTATGRDRFIDYLSELERVLKDAREMAAIVPKTV